ncbi:MAG: hypothetical protein JNJ88_08560 [Planctomycetes bacterium]|nr:hypothetical protein [Planctomycetota bacterium]
MKAFVLSAALIASCASLAVSTFSPPASAGASVADAAGENWAMEIEMCNPMPIVVGGGSTPSRIVWFVAFDVANKSGAARTLTPFVKMRTETGKEYNATYDPDALRAIRGTAIPEAVDIFELNGPIEDGAKKRMVATFGDVDTSANHLDVHLQGFAASLVRNGAKWDQMNREYQASFHRPGPPNRIVQSRVKMKKAGWTVVETKKVR